MQTGEVPITLQAATMPTGHPPCQLQLSRWLQWGGCGAQGLPACAARHPALTPRRHPPTPRRSGRHRCCCCYSLYVESIDVGEAEPRTIVSGLKQFVALDAMQVSDLRRPA